MFSKLIPVFLLAFTILAPVKAQEKPAELQLLKDTIGVWDATMEAWPAGPDAESVKFSGVETNEAYGTHWISSDFVSEYQGKKMKIHSIIGYDLDQKRLVGTIIDHGPYAAKMTGEFDAKSKTIHWTTKVKGPDGTPIVQKTSVTYKNVNERHLVLSAKTKGTDEFVKVMEIKYVKRK